MSYATVSDLVARYGEREIRQRSDRENTGAIDEAVVQQALDHATALIDGRLRKLYAVPLNPVPLEIRDHCQALARWKLYDDRVTEAVKDEAEHALAELDKIARGLVTLEAAPATAGATTAGLPQHTAPDRVFTREALREF